MVLVMPVLLLVSMASAQPTTGAGSGENPQSDQGRAPFKIKLSGVINPEQPEEGSRIVSLGIDIYHETYKFEVAKAQAFDNPQVSEYAILQQAGAYPIDFNLIGPKDLLSKIGQAEPGTPLAIVGFFSQRYRRLQLESVEIIGMGKY
jgi:hypothetical protein